MRFAVNVGFLFTELPYLERFAAAADAGFHAVETPWPQGDRHDVTAAILDAGVELVQLNADAGDLAAGHRGYANDPSRVGEWRDAVTTALAWGRSLGRPACNLLVGNRLRGVAPDEQHATLVANLRWAADRAQPHGLHLLVEVLNDVDTPDYLLTSLEDARRLLTTVDAPGLGLQFDTYHVATMHGELVPAYRDVRELVAHVQLADMPGRHEPGTGTSDLAGLLGQLVADPYDGVAALEYVPATTTLQSLAWLPVDQRGAAVLDVATLRL